MFATFAPVIVSRHDGFSTHDTRREVSSALPATCIVFAYSLLTVSSGAFNFFSRSLLWRMFGEYANSHVNVFLSVLWASHSFKFDECSRTLFVTLK